jgi:hypothetical protein
MGNSQAYLNLFYILVAFPLGVFYFVFLVSGLSTGISLLIVWAGIPILVLVGVGWWVLANFERLMAIYWLKEDVGEMGSPSKEGTDTWTRFVAQEKFALPVHKIPAWDGDICDSGRAALTDCGFPVHAFNLWVPT